MNVFPSDTEGEQCGDLALGGSGTAFVHFWRSDRALRGICLITSRLQSASRPSNLTVPSEQHHHRVYYVLFFFPCERSFVTLALHRSEGDVARVLVRLVV